MKYRPLLLSLVVAASAFACDDAATSGGSPTPDAGVDSGAADSGADAEADAGVDSGIQCTLTPEIFQAENAPFGLTLSDGELWWTAITGDGGFTLRRLATGAVEPETVFERASELGALAVSEGVVYYPDREADAVYAWDASSGERSIASVPGLDGFAITLDGDSLYVLAHGDGASGFTHQAFRVPRSGGVAQGLGTIDVGPADGDLIHGLKRGSEGIYWTTPTGSLMRLDPQSGEVEERLAVSDGIRSWDLDVRTNGDDFWFVRWTDDPEIWVLRAGSTEPTLVLAEAHGRTALHFHRDIVYWSQAEGIFALDATAAAPQALRIAELDGVSVTSFVNDGSRLLWANSATLDFGGGLGRACLGLP